MKQLLRLFLGIIPCLLFSCDYSPSGSHFEDINPVPNVAAEITLDSERDTLFLRGNVYLRFNYQIQGRKLLGYRLELDDKEIASGGSFDGRHLLETKNYANGMHKLKLTLIGNSGTGSLADKSGAEGIQIYRTWVVLIDNSPVQGIALTSVRPENGRLRVDWQPYKGTGFERYDIIRQLGHTNERVCATITDPKQTSWTDTEYVGGEVAYRVALHVNGNDHGLRSEVIPFYHPLPHILKTSYNEANELKVTFSSTPFYNNFGKYELHMNREKITSTGLKDTVMTLLSPEFGGEMQAYLYTEPKQKSNYTPTLSTSSLIPAYGKPWGPHEVRDMYSRTAAGMFYTANYEQLQVIDAATLQVKKTRHTNYQQYSDTHQNVVSADGKYMYAIFNFTLHRLDPLTLQTLATYDIGELLPKTATYLLSLHGCSKDNRLVVKALSESTEQFHTYVVDMNLKKVLLQKQVFAQDDVAALSHDGKTVRVMNEVYTEITNGNWQKLNIGEQEVMSLKFHPTKPLFYTSYGAITFYNTNGTKYKTLHTEVELNESEIDAGSGYLYGVEDYVLYVYDIDTGQLRRKLPLGASVYVFVYKNRIYSQDLYIEL